MSSSSVWLGSAGSSESFEHLQGRVELVRAPPCVAGAAVGAAVERVAQVGDQRPRCRAARAGLADAGASPRRASARAARVPAGDRCERVEPGDDRRRARPPPPRRSVERRRQGGERRVERSAAVAVDRRERAVGVAERRRDLARGERRARRWWRRGPRRRRRARRRCEPPRGLGRPGERRRVSSRRAAPARGAGRRRPVAARAPGELVRDVLHRLADIRRRRRAAPRRAARTTRVWSMRDRVVAERRRVGLPGVELDVGGALEGQVRAQLGGRVGADRADLGVELHRHAPRGRRRGSTSVISPDRDPGDRARPGRRRRCPRRRANSARTVSRRRTGSGPKAITPEQGGDGDQDAAEDHPPVPRVRPPAPSADAWLPVLSPPRPGPGRGCGRGAQVKTGVKRTARAPGAWPSS